MPIRLTLPDTSAAAYTSSAAGAPSGVPAADAARAAVGAGDAFVAGGGRATTSSAGAAASALAASGEPSRAAATASSVPGATLKIGKDSSAAGVGAFLGPLGAVPKVAITPTGTPFLVFGTFKDPATGQTLVRTASPTNPNGKTTDLPLSSFQQNIALVQTPTTPSSAQLTVPDQAANAQLLATVPGLSAGDQVTFNGYYQDPSSGLVAASITDQTTGQHIDLAASAFSQLFGGLNTQSAIHGLLSGDAQSAVKEHGLGGASGDGFGVSPTTSPADFQAWLAKGSGPALADNADGSRSLVQAGAAGQNSVTVTPLSPPGAAPQTLPTSTFLGQATYVDRATAGAGLSLTAQQSAGGLTGGQSYTFAGLATAADGSAAVTLKGAGGDSHQVSVADTQTALGQAGFANLVDSAQTNPSGPEGRSTYETVDGTTAAGQDGSGSVKQGAVGDCYLEASLSGLEKNNPNFIQQSIRPSQDGNPSHYDVRFFLPSSDGGAGKPVWVTVNNQLPTSASGKVIGSQVLSGQGGLADIGPALVEKAYVQFNQQYHVSSPDAGYEGIGGGLPASALQILTGQPAQFAPNTNQGSLAAALQAVNGGGTAVLGTGPSNSPQPGVAPNIIAGHAYTLLGSSTDANGQQLVTLRNPWGQNTDPAGKPLANTDGVFTVPFADVQQYFSSISWSG